MPQSASLGLPSTPSAPSLAQLAAAGPTAKTSGGVVRLSRLNLIDLAGSEKATSDGDRQKEGGFINKSLLDLATVIEKLTDAKPQAHIPYRNSKLTRLLQDSLSGHARIAVICTISLQDQHAYEALATLKFARRVSRIVTRAERGTVVPEDALMEYYRSEIADLRRQLAAANAQARGPAIKTLSDESSDDDCDAASGGPAEETRQARQARLRELTAARVQHEEDVQRLQMERTKLQSQISNMCTRLPLR
jgi:centromeric protein E